MRYIIAFAILLTACESRPRFSITSSGSMSAESCILWPEEDTSQAICTPERAKRDQERLLRERYSHATTTGDNSPAVTGGNNHIVIDGKERQ